MSAYLLSIVGIVLVSGLLSAILPEGKTASMIKGTAKLACLIVILSPILQFFTSLKNGEDFSNFSEQTVIQTDKSFIDYCSKERIESVEESLAKELKDEFGRDVAVTLLWEYGFEKTDGLYEVGEIKILKAELVCGCEEREQEMLRGFLERKYGIVEVSFCDERTNGN